MPCQADPFSRVEDELARVLFHLRELQGEELSESDLTQARHAVNPAYDDENRRELLNKATATLCRALKDLSEEQIKEYTLSLQIWWLRHQQEDEIRELKENHQNES